MRDIIIKEGAGVDAATQYISTWSVEAIPLAKTARNKPAEGEPSLNLTLNVRPFEVTATLPQLETIKKLYDHINAYKDFLKARAEKLKDTLKLKFTEKEIIDEYVPRFRKIILKAIPVREKVIKEKKKGKEDILISCVDVDDFKRLNLFLSTLPRRYISWSVKEAVKIYEKERRIRALKESKEGSGKILFGLISFKKDQENLVTSNDVVRIEAEIAKELGTSEWAVPAHETKERLMAIINIRTQGVLVKYYEDSQKQKELGVIHFNNVDEKLRITLQGRNLYYSRRFYNIFAEFDFVSEGKSASDQIAEFYETFKKIPFPIETIEEMIRAHITENNATENEKRIVNKVVFKPFYYENYKKEDDTIDERPQTSQKAAGDDGEVPNDEEDDDDDDAN